MVSRTFVRQSLPTGFILLLCSLVFRLQESLYTGLSKVSPRNVLAFTTTFPHRALTSSIPGGGDLAGGGGGGGGGPYSRFLHRVYLCDLNTPWDLHLLAARSAEVTCLAWDESGSYLCLADSDGWVELWRSRDHLLSHWRCAARERLHREIFLEAKFVYRGKMVSVLHCSGYLGLLSSLAGTPGTPFPVGTSLDFLMDLAMTLPMMP